jgi:hypothetical protein
MPWRISGAVGMKGVVGTTAVTEGKSDEREVGRENPVNEGPSRPNRVDIPLMSGAPRQLETFDIAGKCEHDMGCHVKKVGRLSHADIT